MRCRQSPLLRRYRGHILPFHSICTFARCFDTFILGHAPILACWLWFLCMYAGIPSCLAMLWALEFEGVHIRAYLIHCPGHSPFFSSVNGDCDFLLVIYRHFLVLHQGIPLSFFMMEVFNFWLLRVISWQSLDIILGAYLFVIKFGGSPASRLNSIPCSTCFQYSPGFYPFSVFARTLLRYSPGFYPFSIGLTLLQDYGFYPFRYWTFLAGFHYFSDLLNPSRFSPEFYPFSVLASNPSPILGFYPLRIRTLLRYSPDSTLFQDLPKPFSYTRLDSTLFRCLPKPFSVGPDSTCFIPPFPKSRPDSTHFGSWPAPFSDTCRILPARTYLEPSTRPNSTLLLYLPGSDPLSFPAS
ncbi:hypothetical protein AAG906_019068 [Vitis piasezkii]